MYYIYSKAIIIIEGIKKKLLIKLKLLVYQPGQFKDVKKYIKKCIECICYKLAIKS